MEVILEDGSSNIEGFSAHIPKARVNGSFAEQLGLEMTEPGFIQSQPTVE